MTGILLKVPITLTGTAPDHVEISVPHKLWKKIEWSMIILIWKHEVTHFFHPHLENMKQIFTVANRLPLHGSPLELENSVGLNWL